MCEECDPFGDSQDCACDIEVTWEDDIPVICDELVVSVEALVSSSLKGS